MKLKCRLLNYVLKLEYYMEVVWKVNSTLSKKLVINNYIKDIKVSMMIKYPYKKIKISIKKIK